MPEAFLQRLLNAGHATLPGVENVPSPVPTIQAYTDWPRYYQAMFDYYQNTSLYDEVVSDLRRSGQWTGPMKGLRNPRHRIVEFYVKHVWSGDLDEALPFARGTSQRVESAVRELWGWSNWEIKKQQYMRWLRIFGDSFLKVAEITGDVNKRLILQQIDPRLVTVLEHDDRDFLTYLRMDDERIREDRDGSHNQLYVRTEVWDKSKQLQSIYEHPGDQYDVSKMRPVETHEFREFGGDFIPIVWTKFRDTGEERGIGAYTLLLDKIDELNRAATRLHQMLFRYNRALLAISSAGVSADGRPLPPVQINGRTVVGGDRDTLYMGDDQLLNLPSGAKPEMLVANIDYAAALSIVEAQLREIENDAPELLYYKLKDMHDASGRAVRMFLGPAIKSVEEVRANAEAGLVRAHQMRMTIGQDRVFSISVPGKFEDGDFDHKFKKRDVIPMSEADQAQMNQDNGQAATYWLQVGIKREAIALRLGFELSDLAPEPVAIRDPSMPTNTPQGGPNMNVDDMPRAPPKSEEEE